jgi:Type IV secretion system pilin
VNSLKQIVKKVNLIKILEVLLVVGITVAPFAISHAQVGVSSQYCNSAFQNCNAGNTVGGLIRTVINWLLGIAFGIAILFLIIGGFFYITSAGNEETAEKGKGTALNAIIGIVIIILSYVVVNVVANLVSSAGNGSQAG